MNSTKYQAYVKTLYERAKQYYNQGVAAYQKKDLEGVRAALRAVKQVWRDVNEYHIADNMFANTTAFENTRSSIAEYKKYIKTYIERLEQMVARLESISSQGTGDARTDAFSNPDNVVTDPSEINSLGGLQDYVRTELGNTKGTEQKSYLELLAELLSQQQQYQWQKESDDLAYSRTNQYALVAQLVSMGMSRQAAIAAVAGTAADVSGSGVGASLSPDIAGTGLGLDALDLQALGQQQGYQLGKEQNSIAQMSLQQQAQLLHEQTKELSLQNWTSEQEKHAKEVMKSVYGYVYGMQRYHFDVPTSATISQTEFKKWLRAQNDAYKSIQGMISRNELILDSKTGVWMAGLTNPSVRAMVSSATPVTSVFPVNADEADDEGNLLHVTKWSAYDSGLSTQVSDMQIEAFTDEWLQGLRMASLAFDSIQENTDNQFFGCLFEDYFMSNAGPRGYHEQEDESFLRRNIVYAKTIASNTAALAAQLESQEFRTRILSNVVSAQNNSATYSKSVQQKLVDRRWVMTDTDIVDASGNPVSALDMLNVLNPTAFSYLSQLLENTQLIQQLSLATDKVAYDSTVQLLRSNLKLELDQNRVKTKVMPLLREFLDTSGVLQATSALNLLGTIFGGNPLGLYDLGRGILADFEIRSNRLRDKLNQK